MTTDSFEPEPDWETDSASEIGLDQIYTSLFDGVIIGDPTDLYWAGGILINSPDFFSGLAGYAAIDLADEICQPAGEDLQFLVDEALTNAIRSYEYSEVIFNAGLVIAASKICGFDRKWLSSVVRPTARLLNESMQPDSKSERKVLRQRGLEAVGALGLRQSLWRPLTNKKIFNQV